MCYTAVACKGNFSYVDAGWGIPLCKQMNVENCPQTKNILLNKFNKHD